MRVSLTLETEYLAADQGGFQVRQINKDAVITIDGREIRDPRMHPVILNMTKRGALLSASGAEGPVDPGRALYIRMTRFVAPTENVMPGDSWSWVYPGPDGHTINYKVTGFTKNGSIPVAKVTCEALATDGKASARGTWSISTETGMVEHLKIEIDETGLATVTVEMTMIHPRKSSSSQSAQASLDITPDLSGS